MSTPTPTKKSASKYKYIGPDYPHGKKVILGGAIMRKLDPRNMSDQEIEEFLSAYPLAEKYFEKS